jgi:hypothetical protein
LFDVYKIVVCSELKKAIEFGRFLVLLFVARCCTIFVRGFENSVKYLGLFYVFIISRSIVLWFLAISSGKGGLDGWRMMAADDTGTDLWTVAGAWEELEGGGVAV